MSAIPKGDDYEYNDDRGENGVCDRDYDGVNNDDGGEGGEIIQGGGRRR